MLRSCAHASEPRHPYRAVLNRHGLLQRGRRSRLQRQTKTDFGDDKKVVEASAKQPNRSVTGQASRGALRESVSYRSQLRTIAAELRRKHGLQQGHASCAAEWHTATLQMLQLTEILGVLQQVAPCAGRTVR